MVDSLLSFWLISSLRPRICFPRSAGSFQCLEIRIWSLGAQCHQILLVSLGLDKTQVHLPNFLSGETVIFFFKFCLSSDS